MTQGKTTDKTDPPVPQVDPSSWQVPSYREDVFAPKSHRFCLVIPVINEGDRIRGQLTRIAKENLSIDVVVADGGSTDGSLAENFVRATGVRAVLTKTGPGKLSAQLRMAYAWCIQQGYEGIVTIDGNGKDGVEAIAEMITKLEYGYDYVQGSRYLPGGVAENTPFERTVANRFIHAPLLSLAGRHWFTDTTNGFRAYSARYLTDPRVRPFRDKFQRYGLLFYLTIRAGQIGLKVGQVPVARRYPANERVPTKISGMASKLSLLGEAVFAATGGYTPDAAAPANPRWIWPVFFTLLMVLPLFASKLVAPNFSPDSWAYYELGQTVFGDFYRFAHFRSYWTTSSYSASFPPLFPVIIAVVDGLLDTGARSGIYVAFLAFAIFALLSEQIGRRAFGTAWLGLAVALLLLLGGALTNEMTAGRSIPLQLVFFAIILLNLLRAGRLNIAGAAGIGIVSGLAILNRFDAVMLPVLIAAALWWLSRRPTLALMVLVGAAVAVSPWIIYSLATFDVFFATDNAGVATSLDPRAFVTDWWSVARPTLGDDPGAWLARVSVNAARFALNLVRVLESWMSVVLALALAVLGGLQYLTHQGRVDKAGDRLTLGGLYVVALFSAIMVALLLPQILAGYFDRRYYTAVHWAGFFMATGWMVLRGRTLHQRQIFARIIFSVIATAVLAYSGLVLAREAAEGQLDISRWSDFDAPDDVATLKQCVADDPAARILVLGNNRFVARVGAQGGLRTMMEPRNMADGRLDAEGSQTFVAVWDVGYVLVANPERTDFAMTTFNLAPVFGCPLLLFRVAKATNPEVRNLDLKQNKSVPTQSYRLYLNLGDRKKALNSGARHTTYRRTFTLCPDVMFRFLKVA
jgi:glycosyltransferase involved in cell wall biosynthesis